MTATTMRNRRRGRLLTAPIAAAAMVLPLAALPTTAASAAPGDTTWAGNAANPFGATDYYIDATEGQDSADGTAPSRAWKSLDRASQIELQPGDRLLLQAGETWNDQQLNPRGSGAQGRPISIDVYGDSPEKPYIATNGEVPDAVDGSFTKDVRTVGMTGAVNLRNQQYWEIRDLEISNDDDFAQDITTGNVVRDGVSISINADLLPAGADTIMDHFRISGLEVHNIDGPSTWQRIHYGGINFQVFGQRQYTEYAQGGHYFQDVVIEDNDFDTVELHAIQFGFNWFGNAQGTTDSTGKFHEGWEQLWVRDRDLYSRDVTIRRNYAENTGQGPIQLANTKDMVVEYNEINGFLRRYNQVSAGLYLWAGADSVMRFNEVYDGPANEYDATPWDLEFTNFDVTYEYNYSHDNQGGWMSYMGNSSNSIARYNLSVNDNGVIVKNMLSTNYSPTYFLNNVFVYDAGARGDDGAQHAMFHDEVFLSPVYFMNNVFYNSSTETSTRWSRKPGALDRAVFSNNAYFEASGRHSAQEPADPGKVTGDPGFVAPIGDYSKRAGVENILTSAAKFGVRDDSPLLDAGRYNQRVGDEDFFGTPIYFGEGVDIGIQEKRIGTQVTNPVDDDPIENEGVETRENLALRKTAVSSTTHPHQGGVLSADKLTDGDDTTRWAAADDAAYPITIDIDFGEQTTFDEVQIQEFIDPGTQARIGAVDLQRRDAAGAWVTFASRASGVGVGGVVDGFEAQTTSALRVSIRSILPGQTYAPTIREIRVFDNAEAEAAEPQVTPASGTFDRSATVAGTPNNVVAFDVDPDGATLSQIRYIGSEGNVLGSLSTGTDYTVTGTGADTVVTISDAFLRSRELGRSGLRFEFSAGAARNVALVVVDSTDLEAALTAARTAELGSGANGEALRTAIARAQAALDTANRAVSGTGNDRVDQAALVAATTALRAAVDAFEPGGEEPVTPGDPDTSGTPGDPDTSGTDGSPGAPGTDRRDGAPRLDGRLVSTGAEGWGLSALAAALLLGAGATAGVIARKRSRRAVEQD